MMKIIDNFLTKSYHKNMLEMLSGCNFEWGYIGDSSSTKNFNEYGFSHIFWDEADGAISRFTSYIQPLLFQILDVTDCDSICRARVDMVTWTGKEDFIHPAHTDYSFPNTATVFYVNESDGDTIFYNVNPNDNSNGEVDNLERVSPKAKEFIFKI